MVLALPIWCQNYDLVISNGRIIDGSGAPWFLGDIAIEGDRIARITPAGLLKSAAAKRRIDATGLAVSPGFIDIQSHVRGNLLDNGDGRLISKITQGITTEIMGEGSTNAPANEKTATEADKRFTGPRSFDAWLNAMSKHGSSANFGSFVGAGTLRAFGKGMAMGKATPDELALMKQAARNAMLDGAFGIASALIYPPNSYQDTNELVEVVREISPLGGVYISHIRSEGDRLLEAIDEAITIGERARVPVEIYHLKAVGKSNWFKTPAAIDKINAARARGLDVQANMYPYAASGTGLTACLPDWTAADGKLYENISNPQTRARIAKEMLAPDDTWESRCLQASPEGVLLVGLRKPEHQRFVGKRLSEVAAVLGKPWHEAALDLLAGERQRIATVYFVINEDNIKRQLREPWIKIATDSGASNPEVDKAPVHPRGYGTYPRVLGHYSRDEKVIPLEDAVRKMTSAVATRLSIRDRGLLRPGNYADIVLFDPRTVADRATFENPHQISAGLPYVLVNGTVVVDNGKHTGAKPGRALRGPGYQSTKP